MQINCFKKSGFFTRGSVLSLTYRLNGFGFSFIGLCVFVRKKSLLNCNTSFMLRNVFLKVAVELRASLYGAARLTIKLMDFAKKKFFYRTSKLYYLRSKLNKESLIKP